VRVFFIGSLLTLVTLLGPSFALAQAKNVGGVTLPTVSLGFTSTQKPDEVVNVVKIVILLTILTLAPAILIMMTSFTRIVVVLAFLRQALGTQQMPPNQLIVGLSLFLSFLIMSPFLNDINSKALQPYLKGTISQEDAADQAMRPLRKFMFAQTRDTDLALFLKMDRVSRPCSEHNVDVGHPEIAIEYEDVLPRPCQGSSEVTNNACFAYAPFS